MFSLTFERHFSRVALVDRILAVETALHCILDIEGAPDTRGAEPGAIHSIPQAVAGKDTFLLEAECNIPAVAGSTRTRAVAGLGSFGRVAGKSILWVEVDSSIFPPVVGIRMFLEVGSKRLFDPSVADSMLTQQSPKSTWSDCREGKLNISLR